LEKTFGKYILLERLGGGGMAEVFKASLQGFAGFKKLLALKLILPHYSDDPDFVQMFIHEANLAARLDHANIVCIHEFDQIDDRHYIAMELVNGRDLRQILKQSRRANRPISIPEALIITKLITRGLAFAHGELALDQPEIIHRDISPHNIIISKAGEVKITDFGIAKMASATSWTRTGTIKGKLAYMSPEQATGKMLDRRTDLFSTGCILWEMLTGKRLFAADNDLATLENLKNATVSPPSIHNPSITAELDQLVLTSLARDRETRIPSAATFGRKIDEILLNHVEIDRDTALAVMFNDLFGTTKREKTAVLDIASSKDKPVPSNLVNTSASTKAEEASISNKSFLIEPAGPNAPTTVDMPAQQLEPVPLKHKPSKKTTRHNWLLLSFLGIPLAAVGIWWAAGSQKKPLGPEPRIEEKPKQTGLSQKAKKTLAPAASVNKEAIKTEPQRAKKEKTSQEKEKKKTNPTKKKNRATPSKNQPNTTHKPSTKKEQKSKPSPRFGYLSINAMPWAEVYLDGKKIGVTPVKKKIPAGKHWLKLYNRNQKIAKTIEIQIKPGMLTKKEVRLFKKEIPLFTLGEDE
jgi:serine/threonine protein kinase